eukprot:GFUD01092761.1.p1 GENE.GFUD01092761.1~~GFUD01092761.1.p1  ORF type:complete len:194 (-),score=41.37 GFUD01092761.1:95-676(-)
MPWKISTMWKTSRKRKAVDEPETKMASLLIQTVVIVAKDIEDVKNKASGIGSFLSGLEFVKHWGVLLKITDSDGDQLTKLVDAGMDELGKLRCSMVDWLTVKSAWKDAAGYSEKPFPIESYMPYNNTELVKFLENFNNRKEDYDFIFNNCQEFVRELLNTLDLGDIFSQMFSSVKQVALSTVKWSAIIFYLFT